MTNSLDLLDQPRTAADLSESELAAAVWMTLADAGHVAATDSLTGDGYQVGYTPGAVLVTLACGTGLTGMPWAAVQRQTLGPWAETLTAAGYEVGVVGDPDAPMALRITAVSAAEQGGEEVRRG